MNESNDNRLVRQSYCKECGGFIRCMALEIVDSKSMKNFEREVKKYSLEVETITLKEFREKDRDYCKCKN